MSHFYNLILIDFIILIFIQPPALLNATKFDIQIKSIRCDGNPNYFKSFHCEVKPLRRKSAAINFFANLTRPIGAIHYHFTVYYLYGTIYRVFLVNFLDIDHCEMMQGIGPFGSNPIIKIAIKFFSTHFPVLLHGCPYSGVIAMNNLDVNSTLGPLLPPVVPQGQYKVYFRYFTPSNETMAELVVVGIVKPNFANRVGTDFAMG